MTAFTGSLYRPGLPPGLYEGRVQSVRPRTVRLDTAAFVGLAERGPVNVPVALASLTGFRTTFGAARPGLVLPQAVAAFFANGGRRCLAVRAMDLAKARTARLALPGIVPVTAVEARNPGSWGNRLLLRLRLRRRALPIHLAPAGAGWLDGTVLAPSHRAAPGVTVAVPGHALAPRTILAVSAPRRGVAAITLDAPLPSLDPALLAGTEEWLLRLDIVLDDAVVEVWDDAALHPAHAAFLPRLLGRRAASEALLPPLVAGGVEADAAWGIEGDPPGSEFLRPDPAAADIPLALDPTLLASPDGLTASGAELDTASRGDDAAATTGRTLFFLPSPGGPGVFNGRPAPLDTLAVWDERNAAEPVALVAMPDLLHAAEPDAAPDAPAVADAPCFGICLHIPPPVARAALPYPLLGERTDLQDMQLSLVQHCEAIGGRIALLDLPPGLPPGDVVSWRRALASDRAALFAPWLRSADIDDPHGEPVTLPPAAAMAGLVARAEHEVGVWASPANQSLVGVFATAVDPGLPDPGFLHAERIDLIRTTERGIQLMGSRTTSGDPEWTHINVRRIVDWLKAQLALDLAWAPFEPNDGSLWRAMVRTAERRLGRLLDAGALAGERAADAFFVRCDRTTMTQGDLDAGRAIMLVGVAPAVPAEFLVFRLTRHGADDPRIEAAA